MNKYQRVNDVCRAILELPDAENGYSGSYDKAEILNALEDLPTIEVDEDCISREWVLEKIDACYGETEYACNFAVALEREIKSAPSVVPKRAEGEWITHFDDLFPEESTIECPICHEEQPLGIDDNYCPNCGAKLKELSDDISKTDIRSAMEYKKWETLPKATIPTENNNCVYVAVALLENEQQAEKGTEDD